MDFNDLSPEMKQKVAACKTPEELVALAQEEGYELSDDELASIAGGNVWSMDPPPDGCFTKNCGTYY